MSRSYNYDDLNRLTEITGDPASAATFAHDPNGNLRTKTQAGVTTTFDYDARDQLRRVAGPSNDEIAGFDYDFQRRRLTKTSGGIPLNYVYAGERVVNEYGASSQLVNRYDYGVDLLLIPRIPSAPSNEPGRASHPCSASAAALL